MLFIKLPAIVSKEARFSTPPQGRADYAFIQHILASLNHNGRCAILLPHGVLGREDERTMRMNMIKSDLVECVIGLGKHLFFNSAMEACILICNKNKAFERRGRVLLIDAKHHFTETPSERSAERGRSLRICRAADGVRPAGNASR